MLVINKHRGRIINPCDSLKGHLWRGISETTYQCARCGECANHEDFAVEGESGGDHEKD
ncbi:hypothetical protein [Bacteriophage Phi NF-1]|uniref:Uncharacterized protein n=1 Tax=Bacteriophage Phi NF-1 TaxID=2900273 RepID=A0A976QVK1_9CAUD|nr:hypothetical protein [Bacteriophage Phi NF-1]